VAVLRFEPGDTPVLTLLDAAPTKLAKNTKAAASRNVGTVSSAAQGIFNSSIRRPQESGFRPEFRETGNFTFGDRFGGTFHGAVIEDADGQIGFGYPDVADADAATNFVWRALEFGLAGRSFSPDSLLGLDEFFPTKPHRLPSRYIFQSGPTGDVLITGKQFPKRERAGHGFDGKHFIENAWIQSLSTIEERYRSAIRETFTSFK